MIPGSSAQAGRVSLRADRRCAGFMTDGWHTGTPSTPLNTGPVSARSRLRVDNIWILPIDEQRIDLTRHAPPSVVFKMARNCGETRPAL